MYKNFLNAYQEFWLKATNFKSKTTRSDWWRVQLVNIIISIFTIPIFLRTFGFNIYGIVCIVPQIAIDAVSYTHLRAHETRGNVVCRLLLE